jgi:Flp pilus assembly protein TadG
VEFALVLPVLVTLLGGLVDYGWYFWREALLVNGLREAVRAGGMQTQATNETGMTCSACISAASSAAANTLSSQGYSSVTITPTLQRIPASGTPCTYAVVIDTSVPHTRLFPLVPGSSVINVRLVSMAQNLVCN